MSAKSKTKTAESQLRDATKSLCCSFFSHKLRAHLTERTMQYLLRNERRALSEKLAQRNSFASCKCLHCTRLFAALTGASAERTNVTASSQTARSMQAQQRTCNALISFAFQKRALFAFRRAVKVRLVSALALLALPKRARKSLSCKKADAKPEICPSTIGRIWLCCAKELSPLFSRRASQRSFLRRTFEPQKSDS